MSTKASKERVYNLLVNRVPGIRNRYLKLRRNAHGVWGRVVLWCRLLLWNLQYYLLGRKSLQVPETYGYYEKKKLRLPESENPKILPWNQLAEQLAAYDVISFDVFDTLVLRPFAQPSDLFFFLGMEFSMPDFPELRKQAEETARKKKINEERAGEVTLEEIWRELESRTGIRAEAGIQAEWRLEQKYCYANPYFLPVLAKLREKGKYLAITSDMYLGKERVRILLEQLGLGTFDAYFVSSEVGASKAEGGLFRYLQNWAKKRTEQKGTLIHVGDHLHSDIAMAKKQGILAFWYPNPQQAGQPCRSEDMSRINGSIYKGLVNNRLHAGDTSYSLFYEFGYVYGGIVAAGYCQFIHRFVKERGIATIWFLARDGDVLKKVYDFFYPGETTRYVLWSRNVSARLAADAYRQDFFLRFLFQKINQGYTMEQIFSSMALPELLESACAYLGCEKTSALTEKLAKECRDYLTDQWEKVLMSYETERKAAIEYLTPMLGNASRVAVVDIGWAGSGALGIARLLEGAAKSCKVYSILAGSNTCHNPAPDVSEGFFFTGQMASYLFSQQENRDLWKFHDLYQKHNLYLELLFTSPEPSFKGFTREKDGRITFRFGKREGHEKEIRQIQTGILDFAKDYKRHFGEYLTEGLGDISGRDAYAPFLLFLKDRKIQKKLESSFSWDTSQNVD